MKQAMIFAAGLGTRLRPLTDHCPKALVPVDGRPLLGILLDRLCQAGFDRTIINIHHFGEQIVEFVKQYDAGSMEVIISDERDLLLDTGGGLRRALPILADAPVLVHNVDIVTNLDLNAFYGAHLRAAATDGRAATLGVNQRETSRYLLFDTNRRLCGWTNLSSGQVKSPYADFSPTDKLRRAFMGIHVVDPSLFPLLAERNVEPFSIIDFYLSVANRCGIMALDAPTDLQWVDAGKPEALVRAAEIVRGAQ